MLLQRLTRIISTLINTHPTLDIITKTELVKEICVFSIDLYNKHEKIEKTIKNLEAELDKLKNIKCKRNYY
jgi:hypothetical protein